MNKLIKKFVGSICLVLSLVGLSPMGWADASAELVEALAAQGITLTPEQEGLIDQDTSIDELAAIILGDSTDASFVVSLTRALVALYPNDLPSIAGAIAMGAPAAAGVATGVLVEAAVASGSSNSVISIVSAAVTVAPSQALSIADAAVEAAPQLQDQIIATIESVSGNTLEQESDAPSL